MVGFENEIGEGKGKGYTVNVPLPQDTDDEAFMRAFSAIVPPLLEAYAPDLVIAELGADTHISDPLTHLSMTNVGYCQAVEKLKECSSRILALGGGGYDVFKTARSWTLAWGILNDLEPRDEYLGLVGGMMFGPEIEVGSLQDKTVYIKGSTREKVTQEIDRILVTSERLSFRSIKSGKKFRANSLREWTLSLRDGSNYRRPSFVPVLSSLTADHSKPAAAKARIAPTRKAACGL